MLERNIVSKIMHYINDLDPRNKKKFRGFAWKNHGGAYSLKGLPDIMAVIRKRGKPFFVCFEVKQPGNKPTDIQVAIINRFKMLGIYAEVVTSLDEVKALIDSL